MTSVMTPSLLTQCSYIGCMLVDPERAKGSVSRLAPPMFDEGFPREVFAAAKDLLLQGKAVDPVTIAAFCASKGPDCYQFVESCMEMVVSVSHLEDYEAIILEDYRTTRWKELASNVAFGTMDSSVVEGKVERELEIQRALAAMAEDPAAKEIGKAVDDALASLQKPDPTYLTGWKELDRMGVIEPGSVVIVAGRPGGGKTDLTLNLALNLSKRQKVYYLSLEESRNRLTYRILSRVARIDHSKIRFRNLNENERGKLNYVAAGLKAQSNLILDSSTGITLELIRSKALKFRPDVLIVDHCGLVVDEDKRLKSVEVISKMTAGLKRLAMSMGICIIECVQLNRGVDKSGGAGTATLADLKGSGSYEQDSNAVIFVENNVDGTGERLSGDEYRETSIRIAKNRDGPTGRIDMNWWPQYHEWHPADMFTPIPEENSPFEENIEQTKM